MYFYFLFLVLGLVSGSYLKKRPDEGAEWSDVKLDTVSLIQKYHYPAELHRVTTKDGYILTLHRIPYGRLCPKENVKGVIILQHGVFSASTHYVLPGTKNGLDRTFPQVQFFIQNVQKTILTSVQNILSELSNPLISSYVDNTDRALKKGYVLADSCYDVWMPNSRGSSHSLDHVKYSTLDYEYWDFSWHEMGIFDQPAVFDYVLETTGVENVTYIGHSQGTSTFFVFNSRHPEYTEKIRAAFLMAPIAYLSHTRSFLIQLISKIYRPIEVVGEFLKLYNLMEQKSLMSNITSAFCSTFRPFNPIICENALFLAFGFDEEQTNTTFYSIVLKNELYGSSVKQLTHYAQLVDSGKFREYDYGLKNLDVYGQSSPPDYDLTAVQAPIHIYYATNDWLADLQDLNKLFQELPNIKEKYLVPFAKFNHMDHVFATDVLALEYDHLVQELDKYYN